ncbi:MAG: bifunctional diaminohydroxyphosphoribosylaminopyrimidine deaminase/5-amino-6-(5-phosphoribosylamino)uracil reductase RibD [Pseudonocardia sp.]|jgi:diaminohydroxyphosphoribosylaminopyrimidine deaminase/5-amino-6-(5-phosphoribosylamino)uracil reductase
MRLALAASARVHGTTSPNPPVGCVVLDADGNVAGVGATAPPGGPHAEVAALAQAGERARGGTAAVTLEPCAHHGRTPPCTDALRAAGVVAVHAAITDPNPVAAGGAEVLRAAGLTVTVGTLAADVAAGPLRAWLHAQRTGRPHVTWKFAATLDGRSAAADGTSRWITGPAARARVHALRATSDAVVVGTGTALADDPALTARDAGGAPLPRQPLRVVAGLRELTPGSHLDAPDVLHVRTHDPDEVLAALHARGVVDVLLEGGPRLAGAFLAAGRVDRVLAHIAPALLGAGTAALGDAGVGTIADILRLQVAHVEMVGGDILIDALIGAAPAAATGPAATAAGGSADRRVVVTVPAPRPAGPSGNTPDGGGP